MTALSALDPAGRVARRRPFLGYHAGRVIARARAASRRRPAARGTGQLHGRDVLQRRAAHRARHIGLREGHPRLRRARGGRVRRARRPARAPRHLPARYVGGINPKRRPEAGGAFGLPVLYGYFKPLPRSESSRIEPQLSVQRPKLGVGREGVEELRRQRPEAARWITAWIGSEILSLSGRAPSTNLAYKWRWQDLVYTRIVTGTRLASGREY
jgi:hypothetical protein